MIIYNTVLVPKPKIEYKSFTIECVKSFKFLGVEIGTKLGWENFINNPLKKKLEVFTTVSKNYFILYQNQK